MSAQYDIVFKSHNPISIEILNINHLVQQSQVTQTSPWGFKHHFHQSRVTQTSPWSDKNVNPHCIHESMNENNPYPGISQGRVKRTWGYFNVLQEVKLFTLIPFFQGNKIRFHKNHTPDLALNVTDIIVISSFPFYCCRRL